MAGNHRIPSNRRQGEPRVIGYIRVSTDEQTLSVETQGRILSDWCATKGLPLTAIFIDEDVSGDTPIDQRPGLRQALAALTPGAILAATRRDRLAREPMIALMIEQMAAIVGAYVATCDGVGEGDTPEARLMRLIVDGVSRYEREQLNSRIRQGMAQKLIKGERRSGSIPYGFTLADDQVTLIPEPTEQAVIEHAKALNAQGLSLRKVSVALAAHGMINRNGHPFTPDAIKRMVTPFEHRPKRTRKQKRCIQ